MVVLSTGKISSTACTVEFAIASAFNSSGEAFCDEPAATGNTGSGAGTGCDPESATTIETGTGRPVIFSAIDCSHAFCSSHWLFAFFWLGKNVNTTPAAVASMRKAEATTRL